MGKAKKFVAKVAAFLSVAAVALTLSASLAGCSQSEDENAKPSIPSGVTLADVSKDEMASKTDVFYQKVLGINNPLVARSDNFKVHYYSYYGSNSKYDYEWQGNQNNAEENTEYEFNSSLTYAELDKTYANATYYRSEKRDNKNQLLPGEGVDNLEVKDSFNKTEIKGKLVVCDDVLTANAESTTEKNGTKVEVPNHLVSYDNTDNDSRLKIMNAFSTRYGGEMGQFIRDYTNYQDLKAQNKTENYYPMDHTSDEGPFYGAFHVQKYDCTVKADDSKLFVDWERVIAFDEADYTITEHSMLYIDTAANYGAGDFSTDLISAGSTDSICYFEGDADKLSADIKANKAITLDIKGGGDKQCFDIRSADMEYEYDGRIGYMDLDSFIDYDFANSKITISAELYSELINQAEATDLSKLKFSLFINGVYNEDNSDIYSETKFAIKG